MSKQEWVTHHEAQIEEMCEATHVPSPFEGLTFMNRNMFAGKWECPLISLYAMHKVLDIMITTPRNTDEWKKFENLMSEHYIEDFDTFNFKGIHQGFEKYLKEKE